MAKMNDNCEYSDEIPHPSQLDYVHVEGPPSESTITYKDGDPKTSTQTISYASDEAFKVRMIPDDKAVIPGTCRCSKAKPKVDPDIESLMKIQEALVKALHEVTRIIVRKQG